MGIRSNAGRRILRAAFALGFAALAHAAPQSSQWDRPAAELAHKIAGALGPTAAHLEVENLSTVSNDSVPAVRRTLEGALKADGVNLTRTDAANSIHVTLSENARGGLWIAEIVTGGDTKVVISPVDLTPPSGPGQHQKVLLHRDAIARSSDLSLSSSEQIIAAAMIHGDLVVLTTEQVVVFHATTAGWAQQGHAEYATQAIARDPRGTIAPSVDGNSFSAHAPGVECTGTVSVDSQQQQPVIWTLQCHPSDDPWPLMQTSADRWIKAFYSAGRDYFTGVVTPAMGIDLPPFYAAALLPGRSVNPALLVGGIDGKVQLAENAQLQPIVGARDWGSDFAVLSSGCSAAPELVASSSGSGADDSLRAYEVPEHEAIPVSDTLALPGIILSLAQADGKSAIAILRIPRQSQTFDYEVDRVTESCN